MHVLLGEGLVPAPVHTRPSAHVSGVPASRLSRANGARESPLVQGCHGNPPVAVTIPQWTVPLASHLAEQVTSPRSDELTSDIPVFRKNCYVWVKTQQDRTRIPGSSANPVNTHVYRGGNETLTARRTDLGRIFGRVKTQRNADANQVFMKEPLKAAELVKLTSSRQRSSAMEGLHFSV